MKHINLRLVFLISLIIAQLSFITPQNMYLKQGHSK